MKKASWTEISLVCTCGLIGGFFAWLTGLTSAPAPGLILNLGTALLGGAIASGAGVYLVANTDTENLPKLVFFALLCGVSWQAVI